MNLEKALEDHKLWLQGKKGGSRANLTGANLDFAAWPLWCGSLKAKIDRRLAAQLAYHLISVWPEAGNGSLITLANEFHRTELPRL
jgi:hypothetical protein